MEAEWINGLITTSPLAGVLAFMLYKLWGAYQKEIDYNKQRDTENLIAINSLTQLVTSINTNLAKIASELDAMGDKDVSLVNSSTNIQRTVDEIKSELKNIENKRKD